MKFKKNKEEKKEAVFEDVNFDDLEKKSNHQSPLGPLAEMLDEIDGEKLNDEQQDNFLSSNPLKNRKQKKQTMRNTMHRGIEGYWVEHGNKKSEFWKEINR